VKGINWDNAKGREKCVKDEKTTFPMKSDLEGGGVGVRAEEVQDGVPPWGGDIC